MKNLIFISYLFLFINNYQPDIKCRDLLIIFKSGQGIQADYYSKNNTDTALLLKYP